MPFILDKEVSQNMIRAAANIVRSELNLELSMPDTEVLEKGYRENHYAALLPYPLCYAVGYQRTEEEHSKAYLMFNSIRDMYISIKRNNPHSEAMDSLNQHIDLVQVMIIALLFSQGDLSSKFTHEQIQEVAKEYYNQLSHPLLKASVNLEEMTVQPDFHRCYLNTLEESENGVSFN